MSFTKKHVYFDLIVNFYKNSGINGVKKLFRKIDVVFLQDKISVEVFNCIKNNEDENLIDLIESKINFNKETDNI